MKRGLLLDVVVGQRPTILKLLAGEDQALLIGRDAFLVLDLGLDILDRIRGLDLECDRLAGECLDEDLHFYLWKVGLGSGQGKPVVVGASCVESIPTGSQRLLPDS